MSPAEPENIVTIAGTGPFIGDGRPATLAGLNLVEGVAVDAAGNLWIADTGNNRVRRVDASTGIITTVAGNGLVGFSGDGGPATEARLNTPSDLAVDGLGNLYFSDLGNQRVRRVDHTTGIISTVAGNGGTGYSGDNGPAIEAQLDGPRGIALAIEASGLCIYIAEFRNHVIRKVDGLGFVTTVAGTGAAANSLDGNVASVTPLNTPFGLALDAVGNLYIGEGGVAGGLSHRVRKVDAVSNVISTVVGTMGVSGFSPDGTLATAARINSPRDIAFDSVGNLYFVDNLNNRIRVVNVAAGPGATITTYAGSGGIGAGGDGGTAILAQFGNPFFIDIDSSGNLYIGDRGNSRVRKVDVSGFVSTAAGGHIPPSGDGAAATDASVINPAGIAFDSLGNAYFAENFTHRIRRLDAATGVITTIAGTGQPGVSPDGTPALGAALNGPQGIAIDVLSRLYIAESGNFRVRRIDGSGNLVTIAGTGASGSSGDGGPATLARLNAFRNVALDASGNLWIADSMNHKIRFVNLSAAPVSVADQPEVAPGVIVTIVGTGMSGSDGDGGLASAARINLPVGLAFDSAGNLFFSESNRVRFVNLASTATTVHDQVVEAFEITTVAGGATPGSGGDDGPATAARFFGPQGLALDAAGNLFIADVNNHRIRRVDPSGVITTVAGTGAPGFSGDGAAATVSTLVNPRYVAVDSGGNLHLTEFGGSRVRRLNVAAKELTVLQTKGNVLARVAAHDNRSIADLLDVRITAIDSTGRPISSSFPGAPAALGNPMIRMFLFGSDSSLFDTEGLRVEGRFATDGRRFSGDCQSQGPVRCLTSGSQ